MFAIMFVIFITPLFEIMDLAKDMDRMVHLK